MEVVLLLDFTCTVSRPGAAWPAGPQSQSKHATGLNVAEEGEDYHGCEGFLLDHPCAQLPPARLIREHHGLSQK